MEQPVQRKGLSKGCLIGIIVAGVLLVIIIGGITLICVNRDKIIQAGTKIVMNQMKVEVGKANFAGLDTTRFNSFLDSFVVRLKERPLDSTSAERFGVSMRTVTADRKIDAEDVTRIMDMIVACYPDLTPYRPEFTATAPPVTDSAVTPDTTAPGK
jgi:hypothetical protein